MIKNEFKAGDPVVPISGWQLAELGPHVRTVVEIDPDGDVWIEAKDHGKPFSAGVCCSPKVLRHATQEEVTGVPYTTKEVLPVVPVVREGAAERLSTYLKENPAKARAAWDAIQKKADDEFEAFKASLTAEERAQILENGAELTLRKHFHTSPTFEELKRMWLSQDVQEVYEENERLKDSQSKRVKELEEEVDAMREAINITIAQADHVNGTEYVAVTDLRALLNTSADHDNELR